MAELAREIACLFMMFGFPAFLMWRLTNTRWAIGAAMLSAFSFVMFGAALISN